MEKGASNVFLKSVVSLRESSRSARCPRARSTRDQPGEQHARDLDAVSARDILHRNRLPA